MNLTPPLREDVHRRVGIPIDRDAAPRTIVGRNVIRGERVVRFDAEQSDFIEVTFSLSPILTQSFTMQRKSSRRDRISSVR